MSRVDRRRADAARTLSIGMLALGLSCAAFAQTPAGSRAQVMLSSGGLLSDSSSLASQSERQLYREIDDPHNGDRWLLVRNDENPGGPGRLVRATAHRGNADGGAGVAAGRAAVVSQETPVLPIIRAGDRLIVEEHTAVVDAVLEARALTPAAAGVAFEVRLTIGGRVVRAVAVAPGRATLLPDTGVKP